MIFHVSCHDSLFYHTREIYLSEWNEDLSSYQQYLMAYECFSTKLGATRWVRKTILNTLEQNGLLMHHHDPRPGSYD